MKDHTGCTRAYYRTTQAHYYEHSRGSEQWIDEVMFGLYDQADGGTAGEMAMRWYKLGGELVPHLECFDDAWSALASFTDLIAILGQHDDETISPNQFCTILDALGFADITQRER